MSLVYHDEPYKSLTVSKLKAPFPYTGGKSAVADIVWEALGNCGVYIEPFLGSGAVLLSRLHLPKVETVNDANGYLTNFFRAIQHDPEGVAQWADYPVSELDLHARHTWLVNQHEVIERMRSDPDYYDVKVAGWWVWGASAWIGHGWCDPKASRTKKVPRIDGSSFGADTHQQRPMISGNTPGIGLHRKRPVVAGDREGNGVHQTWKARPSVQGNHPSSGGGVFQTDNLLPWFRALADRLRRVRICCGDWQRVCTPVVLDGAGSTGIFLDPPYSHSERDTRLYAVDEDVARDVAAWAREAGKNPRYRVVLCGYEGEHAMPGWRIYRYHANGGYGNQGTGRGKANAKRECLWMSPACEERQYSLFTQEH